MNNKKPYYDELGNNILYVYNTRLKLLKSWGYDTDKIIEYLRNKQYPSYIEGVLFNTTNSKELYDNYYDSWVEYYNISSTFNQYRLKDRTPYCTSKDLLMDGLFTSIMIDFYNKKHPDKPLIINEQDMNLELVTNASLAPDFTLMDGRVYLEMKICSNGVDRDEKNRNTFQSTSITIRGDDVERMYKRYGIYQDRPFYYLFINHTDKQLVVIKYNKFKNSHNGPNGQNDGSIYANPKIFKPIKSPNGEVVGYEEIGTHLHSFNTLDEFIDVLYKEINYIYRYENR